MPQQNVTFTLPRKEQLGTEQIGRFWDEFFAILEKRAIRADSPESPA